MLRPGDHELPKVDAGHTADFRDVAKRVGVIEEYRALLRNPLQIPGMCLVTLPKALNIFDDFTFLPGKD